ncbi:MAG: hypothetical protein ACFE9Z_11980 [Promethearchaeota archaeon]
MGLDKWLHSEDSKEDLKKKGTLAKEAKKIKEDQVKPEGLKTSLGDLVKFTLVCKNAKCKYQRILRKKRLTEDDKICPRCKKEMKIKES